MWVVWVISNVTLSPYTSPTRHLILTLYPSTRKDHPHHPHLHFMGTSCVSGVGDPKAAIGGIGGERSAGNTLLDPVWTCFGAQQPR